MKKESAEKWINEAKSELDWALNKNKDNSSKEVYLDNAIRFIQMAKETLK